MEDADSGQPKAKKKKTEKGNEKRWWYVELFFLLYHVCVCAIYHCQTTAAIKIMRNRFVTFNWLAFFRFHERLMHGSILPVTIPPPPGIPPGICNFSLTWRSIPHPRARRKRQFPIPGTPHRPPIRCFVAKPDVLARTSTIF